MSRMFSSRSSGMRVEKVTEAKARSEDGDPLRARISILAFRVARKRILAFRLGIVSGEGRSAPR